MKVDAKDNSNPKKEQRVDVTEALKNRQASAVKEREDALLASICTVNRSESYVQEDEKPYELLESSDPLLNVFSMGWMDDGRLGYSTNDSKTFCQDVPRPVVSFRQSSYDTKRKGDTEKVNDVKNERLMPKGNDLRSAMRKASVSSMISQRIKSIKELEEEARKKELDATKDVAVVEAKVLHPQFICKQASAGYRHSLFLMVNCRRSQENDSIRGTLTKKLYLCGLNQAGLCEERGIDTPQEIVLSDPDDEPVYICAGNGTSFFCTKYGSLYSFGNGKFGMLGHLDELSYMVPRVVTSLARHKIKKVAAGGHHILALTYLGKVLSWGKNSKGQLGHGHESKMEMQPKVIEVFTERDYAFDISCGREFSTCVVAVTTKSGAEKSVLYSWGDGSRGQLGSGDIASIARCKPQENRWVTKLQKKYNFTIKKISCGGWHILALTNFTGEIISWGAGDYGQLGHGFLWDEKQPKVVNDLKLVKDVSAGTRHSAAIVEKRGIYSYMSWGYNGYGELGLGDCNIRSQPTRASSFEKATSINAVYCGDRHTIVLTTHIPITAREDPNLKQYYELQEATEYNKSVTKQLKKLMQRKGLNPTLLDTPNAPLENQAGVTDFPLNIDMYERGLRYCLDTFVDPEEWRHKSYEVCFDCHIDGKHFESVCLSCARHCLSNAQLTPYVRVRTKGSHCQCKISDYCMCRYNKIRNEFDKFAGKDVLDICIGPNCVKNLLKALRKPIPVTRDEIDDCVITLADGVENSTHPRIHPVIFEKWYRTYFNEFEEDDDT